MFTLPKLDYEYDALEPYIDRLTMEIHHTKHHQAYTNNLNDILKDYPDLQTMNIEDILRDVSVIPENIRGKVVNNGGGYYNHNLFWKYIGPKKTTPSNSFQELIDSTFGSVDILKEKFSTAAINHFGSGWAWLVLDNNSLKILSTPNQNNPISNGKTPIFGIDVWEHAYYLKYQNKRSDYINAWWNVVNWDYISSDFERFTNS